VITSKRTRLALSFGILFADKNLVGELRLLSVRVAPKGLRDSYSAEVMPLCPFGECNKGSGDRL
jgi:hypothetical protein